MNWTELWLRTEERPCDGFRVFLARYPTVEAALSAMNQPTVLLRSRRESGPNVRGEVRYWLCKQVVYASVLSPWVEKYYYGVDDACQPFEPDEIRTLEKAAWSILTSKRDSK